MIYSAIPAAQTVVAAIKAAGIQNIIISPGSRNAPLTIGFTEDAYFNCFSIVDERCGGFFALGMALQQQKPVAVLCTSGSAVLNYYPAVAEAFYSCVPIIVISADRPTYKVDIGDGQTIRQHNVFESHIGYSAHLKQDVIHAKKELEKYQPKALEAKQSNVQNYNENELKSALKVVLHDHLPIHINIPLEEPLYEKVSSLIPSIIKWEIEKENSSIIELDEFANIWNASKRKMILVGVNPPNVVEQAILERLGNDATTIVFTETTSNLYHPNFFNSIDSIIAPIEKTSDKEKIFRQLQPDLLITFGGLVVSKKIKAFLRDYQPKHHWHIHPKIALDTFFVLSHHIPQDANSFFSQLLENTQNQSGNYYHRWSLVKEAYKQKRTSYLQQIPFSDFKVFDQLIATLPKNYQVHLANSSTVRYAQLFEMDESLKVYCNRGTSGIDGSTTTAIGAAFYYNQPTVLITGDLSFFYDSNALWNNYVKNSFRIIVVNNGGGGIFKILPGNEDSNNFSTFFETQHQLNAKHLCKMFGFSYFQASNGLELQQCLKLFYQPSNNPALLEVFTPSKVNNNILLDYFDFIS